MQQRNRSITIGDRERAGYKESSLKIPLASPRMRFNRGKYKSKHIKDVPKSYLTWIKENAKKGLHPKVIKEIDKII